MEEKKYYDNFFEFWEDSHPDLPEYIKHIALDAWDAAVNGFTIEGFSDIEICSEARNRGYEVVRKE
jgi:hypothetical protein